MNANSSSLETGDDDYVAIDRYVRANDDYENAPSSLRRFWRARRQTRRAQKRMTLTEAIRQETLETLVLVAPSGTGKSTELKHQARALRAAGRAAAFIEAASFRSSPEIDIDPKEEAAFVSLLESHAGGVLIIDALDQLRFNRLTTEQFLRRLGKRVPLRDLGVRLVVSTHNGAWTSEVAKELGRFLSNRARVEQFAVVTFEPLDVVAVERLASDVDNLTPDEVARFVACLDSEDVTELIDLRPTDVRLLVHLWKRTGTILSGAQLLDRFIDASLVDERESKQSQRRLSGQQGRRGLERVAAAATLMRIPHVATPSGVDISGAISARRLFADWAPSDLAELFVNPLFAHKGQSADIVQLPQGPLSHALAASWLVSRAKSGLPPEKLRDLVLVRVFDEARYEIPTAYRDMVAWLSSSHPEFRQMLGKTEPALLLFGGDPSQLRDDELRQLLSELCARQERSNATPATFRRLARPTIEADVKALLERCGNASPSVLWLLQLVEHGRYVSCADQARAIATSSTDSIARLLAVRALAALARQDDLVALLGDPDPYVRAQLLDALVPRFLAGDVLVSFILAVPRYPLPFTMRAVVGRMKLEDLDALVDQLVAALSVPEINSRTQELFRLLPPVLRERLQRGIGEQERCISALLILEQHTPAHEIDDDDRDAIETTISKNSIFRRACWRERFANDEHSASRVGSVIGDLASDDLEWLWTLAPSDHAPPFPRTMHPSTMVLKRLWQTMADHDRQVVLGLELPADLLQYLRSELEQLEKFNESRRLAEQRRSQMMRPTVEKNDAEVVARRMAIEAGEDFEFLQWAWQRADGHRPHVNLAGLERYLSQENTGIVIRGMRNCWRKMEVPLRTVASRRLVPYSLGIMSITLDMPEFANLSNRDAIRAIRLGFYADNAFPTWYDELVGAVPLEAKEQLALQMGAEWTDSSDSLGVLRLGSLADGRVLVPMRENALALLESGPPSADTAKEYIVDILLSATTSAQKLSSLARREIQRASAGMPNPQWLRLWAHVEPEPAAVWLEKRMSVAGQEDAAVCMTVFSLLERDLGERAKLTVGTWLMEPRALSRWIKLLLRLVRPQDDLQHDSAYSPVDRDDAQDFRYRCLSRISSNPSVDARDVLLALRADSDLADFAHMIEDAIDRQYQAAVEAAVPTWTESDVLGLEDGDEKTPRTLLELFHLVRTHIIHLHRLVANHDFSYRNLFIPKSGKGKPYTKEREIQLWAASCLHERARWLYTVTRENALDRNKEVDISAAVAGVGYIPIEIKPLGNLTVAQLKEVVEQQLLGRYMRPPDRKFGILLLVRRDMRTWRLDRKKLDFDALVRHLAAYSMELAAKYGKIIHVAKIDLLKPSPLDG